MVQPGPEEGTQNGREGDRGGDPGDPAARLLVRIGGFVEPLTRFGRSSITMTDSRHEMVSLMARQVFRIGFETQRSGGVGDLPPNVTEVADAAALARETDAQLAASRAGAATRLAEWAEAHGEDPLARPKAEDCFTALSPVGFVEPCAACAGSGRIVCAVCHGEKEQTCGKCKGKGSLNCDICEASGAVTCQTCMGSGSTTLQTVHRVWDDAAGKERVQKLSESAPCPVCHKTGSVECRRCSGSGQVTCSVCEGRRTVPCAKCKGEGSEVCETCAGHGRRHQLAKLACTIKETFEVAPRTSDAEIASVLKSRTDIADILRLSSGHHATTELSSDTLRRDTVAETPVTSVSIMVGEEKAVIRGYGEGQAVLDYRNIAGLMLAPDLVELGIANSSIQFMPPQASDELFGALEKVLASEANVTIVSTPKDNLPALDQQFRGVVAHDYIARAHDTIRRGLSGAYWVSLGRGPAAVLALPVLLAPLDVAVRGAGAGARTGLLLGVIALTFLLCVGAHLFVTRRLQHRLAPQGTPTIAPLIDKAGLTRTWFIASGAIAATLTLLVAGMVNSLFP